MGRMELGWRLLALLWLATGGWVISIIAAIIATVVMVVDMAVVLIRGKGLTKGRLTTFAVDSIRWNADQAVYIMIGDGSFRALP
jgi:hypothetical protein